MIDIRHGDCIDVMRAMDDACVDAIVTDPPYELSDDGKASANRVAAEMLFPQHPHIKALDGGECHLVSLMLQIVGLGGVGLVPTPAAAVPVCAVALNEDASVRKVEIEDMGVLAPGVANSNGADGLDANAVEHIGDFAFELGSAEAALNALDAAGCGFCAGSIGVGFRVSAASLPSLLRSGGPVPLGRNDIGALNNALARLVCTFGATENESVARLQVGSAPEEWLAASAALKLLAVALLAGAKLIRTGARTSRLPAMLEPRRICVVSQATGRAISFNLLIHKQIVTSKGFMGKSWDGSKIAYDLELWAEAFRVLKPGGHLLAFSATRTQHRMVCAIEDAGFEIRDQIGWMYGQGFPKSLDVSKAIDKAAGHGQQGEGSFFTLSGGKSNGGSKFRSDHPEYQPYAPATPAAQQWAGWGTALKPAWEPICVARKPLSEGTVAANVLEHGTGALNIDGCRVGTSKEVPASASDKRSAEGWGFSGDTMDSPGKNPNVGRWPANVIHSGCHEVLAAFAQFGASKDGVAGKRGGKNGYEGGWGEYREEWGGYGGSGTAARFFYSAKAPKQDRAGSSHPTVKPISLMRYLCKLVTPPGGTVLDMFAGSGTTLQAAMEEGFSAIGIEQSAEYVTDIRNRIGAARERLGLFAVAAE